MPTPHLASVAGAAAWDARPILVTVDGQQGKVEHLIDRPFVRVGSHPNSEVVLPDGPEKRLYLHATASGILCLSLESQGPGRAAFSGWLPPRRAISLGPFRLSARLADEPSEAVCGADRHPTAPSPIQAAPGPELELTTVDGCRQPVRLRLRRPLTIVGRDPPSKLCLADSSISRTHCILYWDDERLWAVDLFSSNGVGIDGRKVEFGPIQPGSSLVLGKIKLTHLPASPVSRPAVARLDPGATSILPARPEAVDADDPVPASAQADDTPIDARDAIIDELRREAREQAEQWFEQRNALQAELEDQRAKLADVVRDHDLATAALRQAEQAAVDALARVADLEQSQRALEAQLAEALARERQCRQELAELAAQRGDEAPLAQIGHAQWQADRDAPANEWNEACHEQSSSAAQDDCDSLAAMAEIDDPPRDRAAALPDARPTEMAAERAELFFDQEERADDDSATVEPPRFGALVPVQAARWQPGAGITLADDGSAKEHAVDQPSTAVSAREGRFDRFEAEDDAARETVTTDDPPSRGCTSGDDDLFDQLVTAQARQAGTQRRRQLLVTLVVAGGALGVLALVAFLAWGPLVRLLGL